ncbi:MAG TPA: hypothetical protein DDZ96_03610 [Porphyromonadaceae bacterium]|nr:hypothetical protein [Porphyromonadaceae bacterium]HBX19509.1 hypothetical protein [Porphyromonadaceae bacterium]HCM20678.1 hypothetical protein [Porphyromonadaceae bacterium]
MNLGPFSFKVLSYWLSLLVICLVYASMQAWGFQAMLSLPFGDLFVIGILDFWIFAGLGSLLEKAIRYSDLSSLSILYRVINPIIMSVLWIATGAGLTYFGALLVLGSTSQGAAESMVPMKVFIAFLLYILMVVHIANRRSKKDKDVLNEDAPSIADTNSEEDADKDVLEQIVIKTGQKIHVVLADDIVYIQSDGDYVQLYTEQSKFLKEETMKYFETHLSPSTFLRVHRSYIVNIKKILRIERYEKRGQLLTLINGHKIKASEAGYKKLKEVLNV